MAMCMLALVCTFVKLFRVFSPRGEFQYTIMYSLEQGVCEKEGRGKREE